MQKQPKILLFRPDNKIGDTLVESFFPREFKKRYPHGQLTLITVAPEILFQNNPHIDKLISLQSGKQGWKQLFVLLPSLRKERYDFLVAPTNSFKRRLFVKLIGARKTFDTQIIQYAHVSQRFVDMLQTMGAEQVDTSYDLFIPPHEEQAVERFLQTALPDKKSFILINPAGSHADRTLSPAKTQEILSALYPCIEGEHAFIVLDYKNNYSHLKFPCVHFNSPSILQVAALIKRAKYVLTVDTSVSHLADMYKKPMTVLFSFCAAAKNNVNKFIHMKNWGSKNNTAELLWSNGTVNDIPTDTIIASVAGRLNAAPATPPKNPLISIIVPVYNAQTYLPACINSLLAQTYPRLEILLIDDGSTDTSPQICDDFARQDCRVRVLHQPNAGVSAARNAGLKAARGEYIGFIDADDYVSPDMYEKLLACALEKNAKIAGCNFYHTDGTTQTVGFPHLSDGTLNVLQVLDKCRKHQVIWNKLFHTSVLRTVRFDESSSFGEDMLFLLHALLHARQMAYTATPLYYYREHPQSVVHLTRWKPQHMGYFTATDEMITYAQSQQATDLVQQMRSTQLFFALAFLRRIFTATPYDVQNARRLQQRLRLYKRLCWELPFIKRIVALWICLNLPSAKYIFSKIKRKV